MDEMIQKVLADIQTIMTNTSLSEPFYEAVLKRLVSFGYTLEEDDGWMICFAIQKVENHIKNSCNTTSVPDGLFHVAVDMVCGEFLFAKKNTGKLESDAVNLDGVVKKVQEGDITVEFETSSSSSGEGSDFDKLLNYLMNGREGELVCYRKLMW